MTPRIYTRKSKRDRPLVDLLIEHGIGVRKRTIEMLEVDTEAIAAIDTNS